MEDRKKLFMIGGAALVVALIVAPLLGWAFGWGGGGGPWMMWAGGWMWFMPLFMVAFWGLVIRAVVALVQGLPRPSGIRPAKLGSGDPETALCQG